ncbi:Uncharacterised protein [Mycobacteroides abscessus subsp. abscessus]|nr:Uncharacterised protein [Mycobacteroides abscessus subsp. abscessus]
MILVFQLFNKFRGLRYFCRSFYLLSRFCPAGAVGDIFRYCAAEQYSLLRNVAKLIAEIFLPVFFYVDAIDQHFAFCRIIKAGNQVEQGAFPAAC